ncbi:MAG: DUF5684 domain-containing protein [Oscillospiraceae bacterium]|nr:DUF5684 domain-containing protein [Oscillospiraceae bacterium]
MSAGIQFLVGFMVFFWIIGLGTAVLVIVATWKVYEKAGEPGWASLVPFYRNYVMFKISWGNGWYFLLSQIPSVLYLILYIPFTIGLMSSLRNGYYGYSGFPFNSAYPFSRNDFVSGSIGFTLLILLFSAAMLAVSIITCIKLAKVFGQGGGFACGLIFLEPVFLCILAFSKSIYYTGIPGKMPPYGQPGFGNPQSGQSPNWQSPYHQPYGGASSGQFGPTQGWGWQQSEAPHNSDSQQPGDFVKFCPDCGSPMKKSDMFCPKCGKPQ